MSYIGVPPFGQTVRTITELTASAGQTTFNVSGGYLPGYVDVFLNGVSLASGDFTSTNGSTVVLGAAASLNDEFKAIAYWPVSLIDVQSTSVARGGGTNKVFFENDQIISADYTITTGKNAMSAGDITILDGVLVTAPSGSTWSIV